MPWQVIGDIAAIVTILGVPYLVVSYRRRVPRFSFAFAGSSRREFKRNGMDFCALDFEGTVKNQSLDPNSIEDIHLVVWKSRRRRGTRSYGHSPLTIDEAGTPQKLPIAFGPRQGRRLALRFEIPLTGTHDAELVRAMEPIPAGTPGLPPGTTMYLPKYRYELAFKDVGGNLFDQDGLLRNEKGIGLRWTLENTFRQLKDGNPFPFVGHVARIGITDMAFLVRRNIRRLGI